MKTEKGTDREREGRADSEGDQPREMAKREISRGGIKKKRKTERGAEKETKRERQTDRRG